METTGQFLSPTGQAAILPYETAPRPLVGFAMDYEAGLSTGQHTHPRAQLLYAVFGVMRIETPGAAYLVPPSTALFLPAHSPHGIRMDGPVAMRALFLRDDAATRAGTGTAVIAVSPLLREVILAACAEPLHWEEGGRGHCPAPIDWSGQNVSVARQLAADVPRSGRNGRTASACLTQQPPVQAAGSPMTSVGVSCCRTGFENAHRTVVRELLHP